MFKSNSLFLKISIPIVLLALGIFYYTINPETFAYTPKCIFNSITGLHCPGCGTQRALHEVLHGNIWTGLQHNFLLLFAAIIIPYKLYVSNKSTNSSKKHILHHFASPWFILAIVLGFWILRNIPLDPFLILAP